MTAITDYCFREKITELKKILSLLELCFFHQGCIVFFKYHEFSIKSFKIS